MTVSATLVKELRDKTGISIMECKTALRESGCDMAKAIEILRKKGMDRAAKKAGRVTVEGQVGAYIHHGGKIGVLIEIGCETDFVSRTEDFQDLVKDLAMHIAAANPAYISSDDVPPPIVDKEKEIYREQALSSGKPEKVIDRIIDGKLDKYFKETCLLDQVYIKDDSKTIREIVNGKISLLGENIVIKRFQRFQLGETS